MSWLYLSCYPLQAQQHLFDIQHITNENGLASLMTTAVHKDNQGILWIGTSYGLNRYDGYQFQLFTKEENGLQFNNSIREIKEDEQGKLWLYYQAYINPIPQRKGLYGIDIFDPVTKEAMSFDAYFGDKAPFKAKDVSFARITDGQKRQWFSTKQGSLFLYEKGVFKKIFEQKNTFIQCVTVDERAGKQEIWLGTNNKLLLINFQGEILEETRLEHPIYGIWLGTKENIYLTTTQRTLEEVRGQGVYHNRLLFWSKSKHQALMPFLLKRDGKALKIIEDNFYFVHQDQKNNWYIDLKGELHIFNPQGEWLYNYENFDKSLQINFIHYFEENNHLWLTSPIGLFKLSVKTNPFNVIYNRATYTDCRGITEDEEGNIYFLDNGIYKWNPKSQQKIQLTNTGTHALLHDDNSLWAGLHHKNKMGYELDLATNTSIIYRDSITSTPYTLLKTKSIHQYLVGLKKGLCYIDVKEKKILPFEQYNEFDLLKTSVIHHLYQNEQGIWIASQEGIFLMSEQTGIIRHFSTASGDLPFNNIWHLHEDRDGVFWLGTKGKGLIKWMPNINEQQYKWKQWTMKEGLSNNYIYAVYEDDYQRLWLPSDKGLMCMDKVTANIRSFSTSEGLPHHEFNYTAHYQAKDGTLYFGGLGGIISFHPKHFQNLFNNNIPLALTGVYLWEEGADRITDKTTVSQQTNNIHIAPSEKFLEIHFSLLDYADTDLHYYAYKIEGYSDKWNYLKENYLRIPALPYGNYRLKIKGQNIQKGWSDNEMNIKLQVLKPFYLKWWFILSLLLLLLVLIIVGINWRFKQLQKDRKRLDQEVRKRTFTIQKQAEALAMQAESLKKLDKTKTRFFSNITHEFRTPLTLIIGPIEQLLLAEPSKAIISQRLKGVLRNAHQLLSLINQMLDLAKLEDGRMKIEVTYGDIVQHTSVLVQDFEPLAKQKKQQLVFDTELRHWKTYFDDKKWDKIVYNLLSNAMKFTPTEGDIKVSLVRKNGVEREMIVLAVEDTGIGLSEEQLSHIFDRFYQGDDSITRREEGTGIGLALVKELIELQGGKIAVSSVLGKGTSFVVELPILADETAKPPAHKAAYQAPMINMPVSTINLSSNSVTDNKDKLILLIIEDNAEIRAYIRYCLDEEKYHIVEAGNGEEGMEKAQAIIPDLIISDVMMPKKDGFEVVKEIRAALSTSHIPIILLTARASLESRLEGIRRGADVYLTKPFSTEELVLRIQKLIEIRQILQQRYQQQIPSSEKSIEEKFQKEDQFITELRAYIFEHILTDNLNGDKIGQHFGMSRGHLHRKIKALTNQSTSEFIRSVRLNRALELLKEKKLNISEITYQTGFSSPSHFTRVFKKAYGKTPSKIQ